MDDAQEIKSLTYRITVQGKLDDSWQKWFANFSFSIDKDAHGNKQTTMTGKIIDQAALRGMLNKLWDLNLSLIAVIRVDL